MGSRLFIARGSGSGCRGASDRQRPFRFRDGHPFIAILQSIARGGVSPGRNPRERDLLHVGEGLFRLKSARETPIGDGDIFTLRLTEPVAHQGCGNMADATLTEDRPRQSGGTSTREDRLLSIDTALGKGKLVLTELSGEEEISQPFLFTAAMRSEDPDIKPESLIGSKVTMWIKRETAEPVPISGMVRSLSLASVQRHLLHRPQPMRANPPRRGLYHDHWPEAFAEVP